MNTPLFLAAVTLTLPAAAADWAQWRGPNRDGHVATTRTPDQKGPSTAMLSSAEVMQGRAQHMTSAERNQKLHYEGGAIVWQGANRVEAERVDIDRGRAEAPEDVVLKDRALLVLGVVWVVLFGLCCGALFTAVVCTAEASEPAPGSVMA